MVLCWDFVLGCINMICCLVRDLFFLYIEGDCEIEMEWYIFCYFKVCSECGSLYYMMKELFDLGSVEMKVFVCYEEEERCFWEWYYGRLLIKVVCLFGVVFFIMLVFKLLI